MPVSSRRSKKRRYSSSSDEEEESDPEPPRRTSTAAATSETKKSKAERLKEARERAKAAMEKNKRQSVGSASQTSSNRMPKKQKTVKPAAKKARKGDDGDEQEYGPTGTPVRARGPTGTPIRNSKDEDDELDRKPSVAEVMAEAEEDERLVKEQKKKKRQSKADRLREARERARKSMGGTVSSKKPTGRKSDVTKTSSVNVVKEEQDSDGEEGSRKSSRRIKKPKRYQSEDEEEEKPTYISTRTTRGNRGAIKEEIDEQEEEHEEEVAVAVEEDVIMEEESPKQPSTQPPINEESEDENEQYMDAEEEAEQTSSHNIPVQQQINSESILSPVTASSTYRPSAPSTQPVSMPAAPPNTPAQPPQRPIFAQQPPQPPTPTPNTAAVIEEEIDHHSPVAQTPAATHPTIATPSSNSATNEEQLERIASVVAKKTATEVVKQIQHPPITEYPQPAIPPKIENPQPTMATRTTQPASPPIPSPYDPSIQEIVKQQQRDNRPVDEAPSMSYQVPRDDFRLHSHPNLHTRPKYSPPKKEEKDILEEENFDNNDGFITKLLNSIRFNVSSGDLCQYMGVLTLFGLSIYILFAILEVLLLHPNSPANLTSSHVATITTPKMDKVEVEEAFAGGDESAVPPCFADSVFSVEDDTDALWKSSHVDIESCISGKESTAPCPKHGRCAGGYLRDCLSTTTSSQPATIVTNFDSVGTLWVEPLYIKNENSNGCMLNPKIVSFKDMVEESIVDLTVEMTCSLWGGCASLPSSEVVTTLKMEMNEEDSSDGGENNVQVETNPPLFSLKGLVDFINENYFTHEDDNAEGGETEGEGMGVVETPTRPNYSVDFLRGIVFLFDEDMIQMVEQENRLFLGLTTEYVQQQMNIPISCWLKLFFIDMIRSLSGLCFSLLGYIAGFLFRSAVNYPIPTLSSMILLYCVAWVRNKRKETRETRELAMRIREIAYERLIECRRNEGGGYAVLFLRDEIGHELYPCSSKERKKFFLRVWPKVISDVKNDNRVRKAQRVVEGGKRLDHWEWIAPVTGRKTRIVSESTESGGLRYQ